MNHRRRRIALWVAIGVVTVGVVTAVAYPTDPLGFRCMISPGANLSAHPSTYTWTDITRDLSMSVPISHTRGAEDEQSETNTETTFALRNPDSRYTTDDPMSDLWPNWGLNTPVKFETNTGSGWVQEWIQYVGDVQGVGTPKKPMVAVECNGLFRRWGQGDGQEKKLRSPLYRSMAGTAPQGYKPLAYWSMEDGSDSTQIASALPGGKAMTVQGEVDFASDSSLVSSEPLPTFGQGASAYAEIPTYAATDRWWTQFAVKVPERPTVETDLAEWSTSGGTVARYRITVDPSVPTHTVVKVYMYNAAGTQIQTMSYLVGFSDPTEEARFYGHHALLTLGERKDFPSAGNFTVYMHIALKTGSNLISDPSFPGTAGALKSIRLNGALKPSLGHYGVWVDPLFGEVQVSNNIRAFRGHTGEQAHNRIKRLCTEEGIPYDVTATTSTIMGPQLIDTLMVNLRDCEQTDHGILDDSQGTVGYRTLAQLYNQQPALVVDAAGRQLFYPYLPTTDDLKRRNRVTARRPGGSSVTVANMDDINGIPGVRPGVGVYPGDIEPNVETDEALPYQAAWIANRVGGGLPGNTRRYPSITVDLFRCPELIPQYRGLAVGDRVVIRNPPSRYARGDVDLMFRGWTVVHEGRRKWRLAANCAPYEPYIVGVAGDATTVGAWLQTGRNTQLATELAPGADTLSVTVDGPLFSTNPADLTYSPLELVFGGEICPVVSVSGAASPQTIVVRRSLPKRHPTGTIVQVHRALVAAL